MAIRGFTFYQPWATHVASGRKQYETRSWHTSYRGLVAIHAGLNTAFMDYDELQDRQTYPVGAILAVARLTGCHPTQVVQGVTRQEWELGDWRKGRYAWKLEHVVRLDEPVMLSGARGLWRLPQKLAWDLFGLWEARAV